MNSRKNWYYFPPARLFFSIHICPTRRSLETIYYVNDGAQVKYKFV